MCGISGHPNGFSRRQEATGLASKEVTQKAQGQTAHRPHDEGASKGQPGGDGRVMKEMPLERRGRVNTEDPSLTSKVTEERFGRYNYK